jgi:hypothetical protein
VDDAAGAQRLAFEVVGEEREQAGADRPGDEQGQAGAGAAVEPDGPIQGTSDGQGQGAAQRSRKLMSITQYQGPRP